MKWLLLALGASFLPIWRDDMTSEGINLWEYTRMAASRKHISPEQAIENYRRNLEHARQSASRGVNF